MITLCLLLKNGISELAALPFLNQIRDKIYHDGFSLYKNLQWLILVYAAEIAAYDVYNLLYSHSMLQRIIPLAAFLPFYISLILLYP